MAVLQRKEKLKLVDTSENSPHLGPEVEQGQMRESKMTIFINHYLLMEHLYYEKRQSNEDCLV